ncbi:MAG: DUF3305 domain-containing protein [Roseinatronobacter sp.]
MPQDVLRVSVLAMRRPPVTRWGKGELRPSAVLSQEPETFPNTLVSNDNGIETWYLGGRDLVLYSGDTAHHLDNLRSERPSIWVAIRGQTPEEAEIVNVTADPYEGEGYASDLNLSVEAVPMPAHLQSRIASFVERYHVEMPFKKRKRLPADPNAMTARAPRILQEADKWVNNPRRR